MPLLILLVMAGGQTCAGIKLLVPYSPDRVVCHVLCDFHGYSSPPFPIFSSSLNHYSPATMQAGNRNLGTPMDSYN